MTKIFFVGRFILPFVEKEEWMNNINLKGIEEFSKTIKENPLEVKKVKNVSGRWNFKKGSPQFSARVEFQNGSAIFKSDLPQFMGGGGLEPDPLQYCLFGLASCFAGTFVSIATQKGIELKNFEVSIESKVNFLEHFDICNDPIVEEVTITLNIDSNATKEKIKEIEKLSIEKCPGIYCLTNPVPLITKIIHE